MKRLPAIVLAAGAALAIPAMAETVTTYYYDSPTDTYVKRTVVYDEPIVTSSTTYYAEPDTIVAYTEPPVIVTAARLTEDQAITEQVIDRIAADDSIHGRVGVDTYMNKVTLTGRVGTPWQAEKAQRHAQYTPGVREVDNQIRGRIGG
jgi:hypothetical protein